MKSTHGKLKTLPEGDGWLTNPSMLSPRSIFGFRVLTGRDKSLP